MELTFALAGWGSIGSDGAVPNPPTAFFIGMGIAIGCLLVASWLGKDGSKIAVLVAVILNFGASAYSQTVARDYNPEDPALIAEGRKLFHDPKLSRDGTVSCATCHDFAKGTTDNQNVSLGIGGQVGTRNAPPIFNLVDAQTQFMFWDGISYGLEAQPFRPLINPKEMGNRSIAEVTARLAATHYNQEFADVFGLRKARSQVTIERISAALSAYMMTQRVDDSPWQKARGGDTWEMTEQQKRGRVVFEGLGCASCHSNENLRDGKFHNTGVELAFGDGTDLGLGDVDRLAGRKPRDRAFKTPTLLNLADTPPYFHNGRALTIDDVLDHYNRGGAKTDGNADALIDPRVLAIRGQLVPGSQDREDLKEYLLEGLRGTLPFDVAPEMMH
jgi:cytochrome c peroxidase